MAIDARIRELDSRHRNLDRTIEEEFRHPGSDSLRLRELKAQKLRLKEQIEDLKHGARAH